MKSPGQAKSPHCLDVVGAPPQSLLPAFSANTSWMSQSQAFPAREQEGQETPCASWFWRWHRAVGRPVKANTQGRKGFGDLVN